MKRTDQADRTTAAVLAQLEAEIVAHGHDVKSLAAEMGKDYNTFRRYVVGERAFPMPVLWAALESLGVSSEVFMSRVADRLSHG